MELIPGIAACIGVKREVATLEALRQIPMPLLNLTPAELEHWEALHDRLAQTKPRMLDGEGQPETELDEQPVNDGQEAMLEELNELVSAALGLDEAERALVEDFVRVRLALKDGKVGRTAMAPAPVAEIRTYAEWLRRELDAQADEDCPRRHTVSVLYDDRSGFVAIESTNDRTASARVRVARAGREEAATLARTRDGLREEAGQWVYFDRSLRLYRPRKAYIFKPIQRMHWTRSQAMLDAADIHIGAPARTRNAQ